ncbi:MAG: SDR family NAD(P)-dependent oxidoreductase [Thermoplasmatales archaeon]|nr:SDR family NAD(P)-dependent oxidoreductase [Thermoplasmatales archaeon]MCW6170483.1 SDR family NAD(P)-dependent oxidoreductase [Thermoplasmatales archaeon]
MPDNRYSVDNGEMQDLISYSRELGRNPDLVLHGGGNTSIKHKELDHTGKLIDALRVKGSGSNLADISEKGFTGLRLDDMLSASRIQSMSDLEMISYMKKSMIDPSEPSPSVESFLHAFLPFKFVMHSHADAILSITNTTLKAKEIEAIFPDTIVVGYIPPGFSLAKALHAKVDKLSENINGIILSKHGLFTFSDDPKRCYEKHLSVVSQAEKFLKSKGADDILQKKFEAVEAASVYGMMPQIRGALSRLNHKVLRIDSEGVGKKIALSSEAEEMKNVGVATPDMLIRTKYTYLYSEKPENILGDIESFRKNYEDEYKKYVKGYKMHDPYPAAIIVRGFGIITAGSNDKEAGIIMDQIVHSVKVDAMASHVAKNEFLEKEDAYNMEYWSLEEAKIKKPKKLEGKISIVTGAASGIGLVACEKLSEQGSIVIACDLDSSVDQVSEEINKKKGGLVVPRRIDVSDEHQIIETFEYIKKRFGGVDVLFNNAGVLKSEPIEEITSDTLDLHYRVNARGTFLMTRETFKIMKSQGNGGNIVFNVSKNLTNPGPGMLSYGTTKAFAAYISHYVSKEGGKYGIRANIINPDKVFRGSKIWEGGVLEARAKAKGQTVEQYKTQNLLGREVLPDHVANVLLALLDEDTFGVTTDAMIPVDGGVI